MLPVHIKNSVDPDLNRPLKDIIRSVSCKNPEPWNHLGLVKPIGVSGNDLGYAFLLS